jgi:hypothetical protein
VRQIKSSEASPYSDNELLPVEIKSGTRWLPGIPTRVYSHMLILDNISTWPVVVQTAAAKAVKQTRFAGTEENNGENGQGEVEEE